ncbi:MAG: serine/threonine-protein kinase [Anaerolineae bacterium]
MSVACPNCGRLNRAGARYCASCQTPLSAAAARLHPGQLLDNGSYRVVRALGKGGMGAVWLVAQTKAFDRLAVLKEVVEYYDPADAQARDRAAERFEAEARTLGELKHPGIPDLYAYFSEGGHNYLVMEYIEGLDLRSALTREDDASGQLVPGNRLPTDEVLRYVGQICEVLEYLARRQPPVVHNDIKPGNIIVDQHSGRAVLVDFGTAKTRYLRPGGRPDRANESIYGTVGYAAPELYRGHSEPRSDVYSLAATAYHLLTDDDPRDHPAHYPELDTLPADLEEMLQAALAPEIADRPSAAEFRQQVEGYLAGESAPLRVLTFPGGEAAGTRDELLALAVTHWRYAAGILQDGTMARWLRRVLHDHSAAQAAEEAVKQWPQDPDAALDTLLRRLQPSLLPAAAMELRTSSIRLPGVSPGQRIRQAIEVVNRGPGVLRCEVLSTQPWVKVSPTFVCPPGQVCAVPIEIDAGGLVVGESHLAAVTLTPADGDPEVVPVQIGVTSNRATPARSAAQARTPMIAVTPEQIDLGTVEAGDLSTQRARLTVRNTGGAVARVRVEGAPKWLLIKPESFSVQPGGQQAVELVGRVDKVRGRKQHVKLTLAVEGGRNRQVEVRLRIKGRGLFGW